MKKKYRTKKSGNSLIKRDITIRPQENIEFAIYHKNKTLSIIMFEILDMLRGKDFLHCKKKGRYKHIDNL